MEHLLRRLLLFGTFLFALAIGATADRTLTAPRSAAAAVAAFLPDIAEPEPGAAIPVRLRIPALGVDAPVRAVGTEADGTMAVPDGWMEAGWYDGGARPGDPGTAVIAGHLDSETGPALFWDLEDLSPGDEIFVTDEAGIERRFVMRTSETFETATAPLDRIFGGDGKARLHLVTCDGQWLADGYDSRLVVFAEEA